MNTTMTTLIQTTALKTRHLHPKMQRVHSWLPSVIKNTPLMKLMSGKTLKICIPNFANNSVHRAYRSAKTSYASSVLDRVGNIDKLS